MERLPSVLAAPSALDGAVADDGLDVAARDVPGDDAGAGHAHRRLKWLVSCLTEMEIWCAWFVKHLRRNMLDHDFALSIYVHLVNMTMTALFDNGFSSAGNPLDQTTGHHYRLPLLDN
ncbi:hypothetical protein PpBr36_01397 [Pyricularia pennisetigena]|uniref:hypothetical protein n=1 Tax=Pyricularia pennisetigena TaxID=1578925 RepID=UPI00114FF543|nr:hypothetical protein PpBr36_01397 [Pyricularia pennisetigena]TLS28036.1 hypothetical protein PpBr36_01397 [Pyricularia pennisetigena]